MFLLVKFSSPPGSLNSPINVPTVQVLLVFKDNYDTGIFPFINLLLKIYMYVVHKLSKEITPLNSQILQLAFHVPSVPQSILLFAKKLLCGSMTTQLRVRVENYVVKQLWPRHTCAATKFSCFRVLTQGPSSADRCFSSLTSFQLYYNLQSAQ